MGQRWSSIYPHPENQVPIEDAPHRGRGLRCFEFVDPSSSCALDSWSWRGLFLRVGPVLMYGNSADESLILCESFAEDHYSLGSDFVLANILGVISAAHLDHHHDLAKLAIDGYVPQSEDVIAKE